MALLATMTLYGSVHVADFQDAIGVDSVVVVKVQRTVRKDLQCIG
jgi:hypothetical protein